ncbi:hypothetical protein [Geminisphaera colitermitum]|uniref:hypothetical protein n=1 Tax=Geminisphaera colitermitum TaxID=1148786 RepID=UPI000158C7C2|nr:hypothetical protein [Geminisphaera colitermitum]
MNLKFSSQWPRGALRARDQPPDFLVRFLASSLAITSEAIVSSVRAMGFAPLARQCSRTATAYCARDQPSASARASINSTSSLGALALM